MQRVTFGSAPASTSMHVDARHWPLYRGCGVAKGTLEAVVVLFAACAGGIALAINTAVATRLKKTLRTWSRPRTNVHRVECAYLCVRQRQRLPRCSLASGGLSSMRPARSTAESNSSSIARCQCSTGLRIGDTPQREFITALVSGVVLRLH